jgi:predicted transcriptional regulator
MQQVVAPRLVKAAELVAREAAQAEAERIAREQAANERLIRPVVRTPRNAIEARDIFNSLFNEAA